MHDAGAIKNDGEGCRLVKAVIDTNNPQTSEVSWIEIGRIPYVIGQINASNRLNGFYDTETKTYWLPYTGFISPDGLCTSCTGMFSGSSANQNTNFIPGVKLYADDGVFNDGTYSTDSLKGFYIAKAALQENSGLIANLDIVKTSFGIHQGNFRDPNATNRNYRHYGVVFSAVNLPTPVTRAKDDVLRLVYSYQLGNA